MVDSCTVSAPEGIFRAHPREIEHGCAAYYWAALWYEGVLLTSVMFCAAMARLPDAFAPN